MSVVSQEIKHEVLNIFIHHYWITLLLCGISIGFSFQRGGFYIFWFLFFFSCIVLTVHLIILLIKAPKRTLITIVKISLWMVTLIVILFAQNSLSKRTRITADNFIQQIEKYKLQHGSYPLKENIEPLINEIKIYMQYKYDPKNSYPNIFYQDPITIMDRYYFDFEEQTWVFSAW